MEVHLGSDAQGGPGKRAAAPPNPSSSLRSIDGLPSLGCVAYTRTVLPLLDSTAYCSSSSPAKAPLAPWAVHTALDGDDGDSRVNSVLAAGPFAPAVHIINHHVRQSCSCAHAEYFPYHRDIKFFLIRDASENDDLQ